MLCSFSTNSCFSSGDILAKTLPFTSILKIVRLVFQPVPTNLPWTACRLGHNQLSIGIPRRLRPRNNFACWRYRKAERCRLLVALGAAIGGLHSVQRQTYDPMKMCLGLPRGSSCQDSRCYCQYSPIAALLWDPESHLKRISKKKGKTMGTKYSEALTMKESRHKTMRMTIEETTFSSNTDSR